MQTSQLNQQEIRTAPRRRSSEEEVRGVPNRDSSSEADETGRPSHSKRNSEVETKEEVKDVGDKEIYSVFTGSRKWLIVTLVSIAGVLSPLTANIYLPALPDVASDLGVTQEKVALSVTVFMIFQGISPLFLGSLTDFVGRRPVYLISLSIYAISNAALANSPNSYTFLMVLRCIQATGSASVIAIGAGVIGDITTQLERAGSMGIMQSGNSIGPAIGPVIGGALAGKFGWRALFYFLLVLGGLSLITVALFLPETLRKLVGNGSEPSPTIFHEAFYSLITGETTSQQTGIARPGLPRDPALKNMSTINRFQFTMTRLFSPLQLLIRPEIVLCLVLNAIPYSCYYSVTTSLSTLLEDSYGLSTTTIGLLYLPIGVGASVAPFINGKILDRTYRMMKAKIQDKETQETTKELGPESNTDQVKNESGQQKREREEADFPIEKARFSSYPYHLAGFVLSTIVFGWTINFKVNLAVPIVFSFFIGFFAGALMSTFSVILVDFAPSKGASATAVNNIFRCLTGALFTSVIQPMINSLTSGWTFTLLAFLTLATFPISILVIKKGPAWRKKDRERNLNRG